MDKNKAAEFYERVKDNRHIFVYSVLGRSSSTAMQRILNSSNEICIFGEPKGIVSQLLSLKKKIDSIKNSEAHKIYGYEKLKDAFKEKKHDKFYAHAINLGGSDKLIESVMVNLFRPVINVERLGFKDIELDRIETLRELKKMFPNSQIVFLFRNPLEQFGSASYVNWWDYSKDISRFVKRYISLARLYLKYSNEDKNTLFVENKVLYRKNKLYKMLRLLGISKVDDSLINNKISSFPKRKLSFIHKTRIRFSGAYRLYLKMANKSNQSMEFLEKQ